MKIGIVGLGVAGSYLAARLALETDHEVYGFEMLPSVQTKCAWGGSKHELSRLLRPFGIDFSEYTLFEGRRLSVFFEDGYSFGIPLKGVVTFDKDALEARLQAIASDHGAKLRFGHKVSSEEVSGFDLVIDSTGVFRGILPKIASDMIFPNIEYRVDYGSAQPFDDFAVFPYSGLGGYGWYFPLGPGQAHVGGGDRFHRQKQKVDGFLMEHPGRVLRLISRPIRMVPPSHSKPIWVKNGSQTVVGVGESVGTVFPLLGEGIIPSMEAAEALFELFDQNRLDLEAYEAALDRIFFYFEPIFRIVLAKWSGKWTGALSASLIPSYIKARRMESRFGFEVRISHLLQVFNHT